MESKTKAYVALGMVCLVWGTTYLAVRIGVAGFPALLFMSVRNLIAGTLLLTVLAVLRKEKTWSWDNIKLQIIPGLCMITFGIGIVGWSVKYIPSGLAALICSMIPIFTMIVNLLFNKAERINWQIATGIMLGMCGVLLVFRDNLAFISNTNSLLGILVTMVSCLFWALGGLYTQKFKSGSGPFFNAGVQMLAGGLGLLVLSGLSEDWRQLPVPTTSSLFALLYLIVFGSILAFCSYLYAMSRLPAGLVSIYAYINPLVAIVLGYIILNEKITWLTMLSFIITMSGVYMVNVGYKLKKAQALRLATD
ncbi:putative inner membrane transporter YedA [Dyadobacter sp. CECT 9275]|uniref:Inner membrane transporter YedA n=1 Tax=Dyadobacter helix TaxID=2822344 RepID=A0A916JC59_9BACT|nr:EamA family transporter [Dyadobacter sp. CECT 9275]CAG4998158.1 putative inner membrane transporter YedA [Dyadobacter sp. CECT 9275]